MIQEAKHESRYPRAQNSLLFAFLRDELVEALNEKNQWKVSKNQFGFDYVLSVQERTNAIEAIESELN